MIYLDHAASDNMREAVRKAMKEVEASLGNASSVHTMGYRARALINEAKSRIAGTATLFGPGGVGDNELIFTSGATEGNNYCIKMTAAAVALDNRISCPHGICDQHFVTTAIEHASVLESFHFLEQLGAKVTYLKPDSQGIVDREAVLGAIRPNTVLVSVMAANNEVGTLQPVAAIGENLRRLPYNSFGRRMLYHVDGVQAFGRMPIPVKSAGIDLLTVSSHKIGGPKGIGLVYQSKEIRLPALLSGGGQEEGRRSGTEAEVLAVGLMTAVDEAERNYLSDTAYIRQLRDFFGNELQKRFGDKIHINGSLGRRLPGNLNITIDCNAGGNQLVAELDLAGIAASTGSACTQSSREPSHVLLAMGVGREQAERSLRFSLGRENTREEMLYTIDTIEKIVQKYR